ncbi:putative kinase [Actinokineospora diospyrosa]|uniref:Kinase n=2 Tax=Actinokineospora diospyrosa TaxID=103728 RepID=A0ABT1I6D8_9PSEU|nr:putative kinase [Actinokineospora diospyrosa]
MHIDLPDHCVVLMAGASGAGKSTLARGIARTAVPETVIESYDRWRQLLTGDPHEQSATPGAVGAVHTILDAACLSGRLSMVVDGTHSTPTERAAVLDIATRHQVPVVLVAVLTPLRVCLARQDSRARPVPADTVTRQFSNLMDGIATVHTEGFAAVHLTTGVGGR